MRLFLGAALTAVCLLVGSLPAEDVQLQLRYRPDPDTAWTTRGHLTVKTRVGDFESVQESDLNWRDTVTARDALGQVNQEREVLEWTMGADPNNLAPTAERFHFRLSKLAEQRLVGPDGRPTLGSAFDQPALFPVKTVTVGETWPVEQQVPSVVTVGRHSLPILTTTTGTGKLVALDGKTATLEFALKLDAAGPRNPDGTVPQETWAQSTSTSAVSWQMKVDTATGVALWQKTAATTDQSVTVDGRTFPTHTETLLELTTTR